MGFKGIEQPLKHIEEFGMYKKVESFFKYTDCDKCGVKGQMTLYCPRCFKNYCMNCVKITDLKEGTTWIGTQKRCPVCDLTLHMWEIEHTEFVCDNCENSLNRDDAHVIMCQGDYVYICNRCLEIFRRVMELIKKRWKNNDLKDLEKRYIVMNYVGHNLGKGIWNLSIDYPIYYILKGFKK